MSLHDAVADAGGLALASELATRWGVSKTWVAELRTRDDFPTPIETLGGRALYPVAAADAAFNRHVRVVDGRRARAF